MKIEISLFALVLHAQWQQIGGSLGAYAYQDDDNAKVGLRRSGGRELQEGRDCGGGNRGNGICPTAGECCSEFGWCSSSSSAERCRGSAGGRSEGGGGGSNAISDEQMKQETGISREDHENRNQFNELPNGKIKPSPEDKTIWTDDDGRPWKLNSEPYAAYHQPNPVAIAFIQAHLGEFIPYLKVPNLKFISPNADGRYSEIVANRYTGELIIEQNIMGTFNLATDAPDAMIDGKLPTTGEHDLWDVIPHNKYGGGYKYIAAGIETGSIEKGPIVLAHLEKI